MNREDKMKALSRLPHQTNFWSKFPSNITNYATFFFELWDDLLNIEPISLNGEHFLVCFPARNKRSTVWNKGGKRSKTGVRIVAMEISNNPVEGLQLLQPCCTRRWVKSQSTLWAGQEVPYCSSFAKLFVVGVCNGKIQSVCYDPRENLAHMASKKFRFQVLYFWPPSTIPTRIHPTQCRSTFWRSVRACCSRPSTQQWEQGRSDKAWKTGWRIAVDIFILKWPDNRKRPLTVAPLQNAIFSKIVSSPMF